MIEACEARPGKVIVGDAQGHRHIVSVFSTKPPKETGPTTVFLSFQNYKSLFVRCSLQDARDAYKRARVLRKAQIATANRHQLEFDFNEKREASAVTPTPRTTLPPEESEVICGGS